MRWIIRAAAGAVLCACSSGFEPGRLEPGRADASTEPPAGAERAPGRADAAVSDARALSAPDATPPAAAEDAGAADEADALEPADPADTWGGARVGLEISCGAECAERCAAAGWPGASCAAERCQCIGAECDPGAPWDGRGELTACPLGMHCKGGGTYCWSDHASTLTTGEECTGQCAPGFVCCRAAGSVCVENGECS